MAKFRSGFHGQFVDDTLREDAKARFGKLRNVNTATETVSVNQIECRVMDLEDGVACSPISPVVKRN